MSIYLATIGLSLLLAQGSKVVAALMKGQQGEWRLALTRSGGMPSAHTALMVGMTIVIGLERGFDSAMFGLSLALTLVVVYDALNVRRSVGEQGAAIKQLVKELKLAAEGYTYKQAEGHHPGEVLFGIITGALAAAMTLFLYA